MKGGLVVDDGFVYEEEKHLTVFKTCLFFANDGFTVYDCKGELVFRVDSYGPDSRDKGEHVLMDAHGRCLLTVRRKVIPSLPRSLSLSLSLYIYIYIYIFGWTIWLSWSSLVYWIELSGFSDLAEHFLLFVVLSKKKKNPKWRVPNWIVSIFGDLN